MATTSVIVTVASQLKTKIEEAVVDMEFEGRAPDVFDSHAIGSAGLESVVIGDILEGSHAFATIKAGRKNRNERYIQRVEVMVIRTGEQSTAARLAAIEILAKIEDLIANDPSIGLASTIPTLRLEGKEFALNTTHDASLMGWRVALTYDILVQARLT